MKTSLWYPTPNGGYGCKYSQRTSPELRSFPLMFPTSQWTVSHVSSVKWPSGFVNTSVHRESGSELKVTEGAFSASFGLMMFPERHEEFYHVMWKIDWLIIWDDRSVIVSNVREAVTGASFSWSSFSTIIFLLFFLGRELDQGKIVVKWGSSFWEKTATKNNTLYLCNSRSALFTAIPGLYLLWNEWQ